MGWNMYFEKENTAFLDYGGRVMKGSQQDISSPILDLKSES
jgi:hypothetical protein